MSSVNTTEYLKQSRAGKHNTCFMCGNKGHYARDCQNDENWRQEVDDGCWTFWYCDDCGKEFTEENEHESHKKCCHMVSGQNAGKIGQKAECLQKLTRQVAKLPAELGSDKKN